MDESKITLYCKRCEKELAVPSEDFKYLSNHEPDCFIKQENCLCYEGGCFYKNVVLLRRRPEAYHSLCGGEG